MQGIYVCRFYCKFCAKESIYNVEMQTAENGSLGTCVVTGHPAIINSSLAILSPQTTASCHVAQTPVSLKNPTISMLPYFPGCLHLAFLPQFPSFYYSEKLRSELVN